MGALAHLDPRLIPVVPGSQAATQIRVRNTGSVVDQFTIEVLGDAQPWAVVQPPSLSLFPGAEEAATLTFSPPRSPQVAAGQLPFGVRVLSKEDPTGSVVEEGVLEVAAFNDVFAELAPRTSRGSRHASHDLAVDNRGNAPLNATLSAADPDRLLAFDLRPPSVVADPGTASFAKIGVSPRKRFWRGPAQTRPFQVQVEAPGMAPMSVEGSMLQEAILPPWTMRALIGVLGVLVVAALLWVFFLQPAILSAARGEAEQALDDRNVPTRAPGATPLFEPTTGPKPTDGPVTPGPSGQSTPGPTATVAPTTSGGPFAGIGTPTTGRLAVGETLSIELGKTLYLTDLFFSNPREDNEGDLRLLRGDLVVIQLRVENFRDIDYHWVTPLTISGDQVLRLECAPTCNDIAVTYSGYQP